jgi:mono/diheme cytochrome c family protein
MLRWGWVTLVALVAAMSTAPAQSPIENGRYLVNTIMTCQNCHTPKGPRGRPVFERDLSGGLTFDEKPFKVTAPNITQDPETGIGNWSDEDIRKLMRTGVRPNGVPLAEVMPTGFYKIITDSDMNAIIAYLRTVKPIRNKVPEPIYKMAIPHQVFPGAEKPMSAAELNDKLKRGFYLVTIGHCMECHTPFGPHGVDFANSLGMGGREFPGPWGKSVSRNITSHKTAGIGAWTDAEIKRAIIQGIRKDGSHLKPPMGFAWYAKLTPRDLDAIVAFLRTVPPKE